MDTTPEEVDENLHYHREQTAEFADIDLKKLDCTYRNFNP